jgi:anthranilate synthase component 1
MLYPTLEEVRRLAKEYNLIPIGMDLLADTETPIRLFQHFYQEEYSFLLESVEGGAKWARYSFIGMDPFLTISGKKHRGIIINGGVETVYEGNPVDRLKSILGSYRSPSLPDLPRFTGGAVGFFGYDVLQYYENLPSHPVDDLDMNDVQFMFCDHLIVFDHLKQQIKLLSNVHIPDGASDEAIEVSYRKAERTLLHTLERLKQPIATHLMSQQQPNTSIELGEVSSNMTKERYCEMVNQAKEYIRAGDIFQVVLSQRFEMETRSTPLEVYRVLRTMNPSPYMYYLKMGEEIIVGTSPELLVRVEGSKVETRPIAGTRPRGKDAESDLAFEKDLLADEKELAEHRMLVDLGRNDLGRVARFGTVQTNAFMEIERYSHVMHIVSNVVGELQQDKDFFDAFVSCMPAGTVSGAPKIRAMQIIAELEKEARGAYAGAIGYLGFSGNLDTCITIRTIIFKHGKAYVQAGAGIVWDSVPEKEYEETVNKAKALLMAIRTADALFGSNPSREELDEKRGVVIP